MAAEPPGRPHAPAGDAGTDGRAVEALPFQVAILDGEGRIVRTNRAWDDFAAANGGRPATCGVGASYLAVCGPATVGGDVATGIRDVVAGRRDRFDHEYPCDSPSERRWFLMTAARLDPPGAGAVVTHVDITRRRAVEESIEQFSLTLAHDLQAPLRQSARLAELIAEDVAAGRPAAPDLLAALHAAAGRGRRMVDALVERLRTERAGEPRRVDLAAVAREVAAAAGAGAPVTVDAMPAVVADPGRVDQVLRNLVGNALKHPADGRPLRVSVSAWRRGDGFVVAEVADTGAGIPPEHREEVFRPMRRLQSGGEGVGIGLALCRAAVEREGGRIWIEDGPEGGTAVRFTLRAA
jgi:signal transduction histidine kinase